ncbi:MAG: hypothetical protein J6336_07070 [Kiritimatiellae bacterium]|nr:hypothetical protein [Kiritimatiellia bacterium]
MKTLLFLACAMVSGWTCVAAPACQPKGDTFPVFTDGIDLYEDGTQVLDGERYALVYVAEGQTFGGFLTDGTLADPANNKIVTDKLYAKGGKCEYTPVQIPEGFLPEGGSFYLLALDTRTPAGGVGDLVNGWGLVSVKANATSTGGVSAKVAGLTAAQISSSAALPADVIKPVIKGIEIKGGKVLVTVEATSAKAYYGLKGADDLNSAEFKGGATAVRGGLTRIVLEYPVSAGTQFFKVVGGTLQQVTK